MELDGSIKKKQKKSIKRKVKREKKRESKGIVENIDGIGKWGGGQNVKLYKVIFEELFCF